MSDSYQAQSPTWGKNTKRIIFLVMLGALLLLAWRFQPLVGMLILAVTLAYLLTPIINFLSARTFLSRDAAVWIVYLLFALLALGGTALIGVAAFNQVSALLEQLPALMGDLFDLVKQYVTNPESIITIGSIQIAPHTIDWNSVEDQVLDQVMQLANPAIGQGLPVIRDVGFGALSVGGTLFITFFVSIYLALEMPERGKQLNRLAQQLGYGEDFERMSHEFNRIWNAYLRGQLVLGIIVALITTVALAILGVQNSLALGILTGILQVIPYVGPVVATALTAAVAFFQPGNYLGLAPFQYALVVTIVSIILQNIQAALLVPRVVGVALDLSPLLVLLSLLAGGALAGILGMLLAAPVVATIKLVARYVWRKLLDLPPFPDPVARPEPPPPTLSRLRDWLNRQHTKAPKQQSSE